MYNFFRVEDTDISMRDGEWVKNITSIVVLRCHLSMDGSPYTLFFYKKVSDASSTRLS